MLKLKMAEVQLIRFNSTFKHFAKTKLLHFCSALHGGNMDYGTVLIYNTYMVSLEHGTGTQRWIFFSE